MIVKVHHTSKLLQVEQMIQHHGVEDEAQHEVEDKAQHKVEDEVRQGVEDKAQNRGCSTSMHITSTASDTDRALPEVAGTWESDEEPLSVLY